MCFFFRAEDGILGHCVTGVQSCALPISSDASNGLLLYGYNGTRFYSSNVEKMELDSSGNLTLNSGTFQINSDASGPTLTGSADGLQKIGRASCRERVKILGWFGG